MDIPKKIVDVFKPYHKPAMYIGAAALAIKLGIHLIKILRRTDKHVVKGTKVNYFTYLSNDPSKSPWTIILFHAGSPTALEETCKELLLSMSNVYIICPPSQQALIDQIRETFSKTKYQIRHNFTIFSKYDDPREWQEFRQELEELDARVLVHFGDISRLGWRPFEELEPKAQETNAVLAPRYVYPLAVHAFAQSQVAKADKVRRLVVHIDGDADPQVDECEDGFMEGVGSELRIDGIEYKRVVSMQTLLRIHQ